MVYHFLKWQGERAKYLTQIMAILILGVIGLVGSSQSALATVDISTCVGLQAIGDNLSEDYVISADIDCSTLEESFVPINGFTGTLDGQNYTISNLSISGSNYYGVFQSTDGATIENLTLTGLSVSGNYVVGGLVAAAGNGTVIDNVHVTGTLYSGAMLSVAGGMVGKLSGSTVSQSSADMTITGYSIMGGLVGINDDTSSIAESYATGTITGLSSEGHSYIGGLVGNNGGGTITDSYAMTTVTGSDDYIGGLVGSHNGDGTIATSYSTGTSTGSGEAIGGLVGDTSDTASTVDSFWDMTTSGLATSDGGTGKTTAELQSVITYTSLVTAGLTTPWDFLGNPNDDTALHGVWDISTEVNDGYPSLVWGNDEVLEQEPAPEENNEDTEDNGPVNDPSLGKGDGSHDTRTTIGKPTKLTTASDTLVTVTYSKGSTKLFQCFATGSGTPTVTFANGHDFLVCSRANGRRTALLNAYTGKRYDTKKLHGKDTDHFKQRVLSYSNSDIDQFVFVGVVGKHMHVKVFSVRPKKQILQLEKNKLMTKSEAIAFGKIAIKDTKKLIKIMYKDNPQIVYMVGDHGNVTVQ